MKKSYLIALIVLIDLVIGVVICVVLFNINSVPSDTDNTGEYSTTKELLTENATSEDSLKNDTDNENDEIEEVSTQNSTSENSNNDTDNNENTFRQTALSGYWYIYSPQDTVADVYKLNEDGSCQHLHMAENNDKVFEYLDSEITSYSLDDNKITIERQKYDDIVIEYVPDGDYGQYFTTLASGPMDSESVTFKIYHYYDHPAPSSFLDDWQNKFII